MDRNHLDQIVIYMVMLIGLILLAVQIFAWRHCHAGGHCVHSRICRHVQITRWKHDMVFIILDHVFG